MHTPQKIVVSDDLYPDLSACLNPDRGIGQVLRVPFILNIYCHHFEKVDQGKKLSSQLWILTGYIIVYRSKSSI